MGKRENQKIPVFASIKANWCIAGDPKRKQIFKKELRTICNSNKNFENEDVSITCGVHWFLFEIRVFLKKCDGKPKYNIWVCVKGFSSLMHTTDWKRFLRFVFYSFLGKKNKSNLTGHSQLLSRFKHTSIGKNIQIGN